MNKQTLERAKIELLIERLNAYANSHKCATKGTDIPKILTNAAGASVPTKRIYASTTSNGMQHKTQF